MTQTGICAIFSTVQTMWKWLLLLAGMARMGTVAVATPPPPPPNDEFTNRIVLTGTNIFFTGNTDGAVYYWSEHRDGDDNIVPANPSPPILGRLSEFYYIYSHNDVWWSWTAPFTGKAVIEGNFPGRRGGIAYIGQAQTNLTYVQGALLGSQSPDERLNLCFTVTNGVEYQIALLGNSYNLYVGSDITGNLALHLTVFPGPVILEQPKSQTVRPEGSGFFSVLAQSSSPMQFQWQHQGTNLPGETCRALLLHQVQTNQAGDYRVIITDATQTTISETAELIVRTALPANLSILGKTNGQLSFMVHGGIGQEYIMETSTNLQTWSKWLFPPPDGWYSANLYPYSHFVTDTDGQKRLPVEMTGGTRFYRARPFFPANEVCLANLRYLGFLKKVRSLEEQVVAGDLIYIEHLAPYMKTGEILRCPEWPEGINDYILNSHGAAPDCFISGHRNGLLWEK